MKIKLIIIILIAFLFLLSSCFYTAKDINEINEEWSLKYEQLEEKYYEADDCIRELNKQCDDAYFRIEELEKALNTIDDSYLTINNYFDVHYDAIHGEKEEVYGALNDLRDALSSVGY